MDGIRDHVSLDPEFELALAGLQQQLQLMQNRVKLIELGARTSQLAQSSINDGTLQTIVQGVPRQLIGIQPDGSVTITDINAPAPLSTSTPVALAFSQGVNIVWDGKMSDGSSPLADFDHVEVHLSTTASFTPSSATLQGKMAGAGTFPVTGLTIGTTYYVALVAVNTSGANSPVSAYASAIPSVIPATGIPSFGVLNPNPFFWGGDLTGWALANPTATPTATSSPPAGSPYPWAATWVTGGASQKLYEPNGLFAAQPSLPYMVTCWVYVSSATNVFLGFEWRDSSHAILSTTGQTTAVPANTWTPLTTVQTSDPAAVWGNPNVTVSGAGITSTIEAVLAFRQVPGGIIQTGTITAAQMAVGIIVAGIVNGTTITGASVVSTGTAGDYLMYAGTPAIGNLGAAFSATAFTDSSGNVVPAGFNWGDWDATGVLRNHFGIDLNGNTYLADPNGTTRIFVGNNPPRTIYYNAAGRIVTYIDPINSAIFQYQDLDTVSPVLAHSTQGSTNTSGPLTITIPATTAGNALIVAINTDGTSANPVVSGVTLGGSGTGWVKVAQFGNALYSDCEIWANFNVAAGQTSVAISLSGGVGSIQITADVYEWSGLANPATDTYPPGASTNTGATSWSSGTSASLSSVTDIAIGIVATAAATTITGPATGGWTNLTQQTGANTAVKSGYTTTPASGGVAYAGTFSASSPYTALAATFKAKPVAQGGLVFAQCAKSTADPVTSIGLQAGVSTFSASGTGINFPTSAAEEAAQAAMTSGIQSPGASEQLKLQIFAPAVSGAGNGAHPYISMYSTAKDGSQKASGNLDYVDDTGTSHQGLLRWGNNKGLIQTFQSSRNGGIPASQRDVFTRTASTIGLTAITVGYTAPGNEVVAGMEGFTYRIKASGDGTWSSNTSGALQMQAFGTSRAIMSYVFSTAFLTSGHTFQWNAELDLVVTVVGSSGSARITGTMWVTDASGAVSFSAVCNALISGFTVDTTAANTIGLNWSWAGTAGGSISCMTSELTRIPSTGAV